MPADRGAGQIGAEYQKDYRFRLHNSRLQQLILASDSPAAATFGS